MPYGKLTQQLILPGAKLGQFEVLMDRILRAHPEAWTSADGELLEIRRDEYLPSDPQIDELKSRYRSARVVWLITKDAAGRNKPLGCGAIEVTEEPGRIVVELRDGYRPRLPDIDCHPIGQAFEEFSEMIAQEIQSSGASKSAKGKGGRRPLTEEELEHRFGIVRKVQATADKLNITLDRACGREGIPYGTFRDWQRRMNNATNNDD